MNARDLDQKLSAYFERNVEERETAEAYMEQAFLRRLYSQGIEKFRQRLTNMSFTGKAHVLDAGAGFGQWSFALSSLCEKVSGCEFDPSRVSKAIEILNATGVENVSFRQGELEKLPFEDAIFDGIICYSVLYLTHAEKSIAELARVMEPGGLLYLSTNDIGRYVADCIDNPNPAPDFSPRLFAFKSLCNTAIGNRSQPSVAGGGYVVRPRHLTKLLEQAGFEVLEIGLEGTLGENNIAFVRQKYAGLVCTYDVLARKIQ